MNLRFNIRISIPWLIVGLLTVGLYHYLIDPVHTWTLQQRAAALYFVGVIGTVPAYVYIRPRDLTALFKLSTYREFYRDLSDLVSWLAKKIPSKERIAKAVRNNPGLTVLWVFWLIGAVLNYFVESSVAFILWGAVVAYIVFEAYRDLRKEDDGDSQ